MRSWIRPRTSGTTSRAATSAPTSSAKRASPSPAASSSPLPSEREVLIVSTAARGARSAIAAPLPALAAALREQAHVRDLDPAFEGLGHVVDGERSDRGCRHRLDLHA